MATQPTIISGANFSDSTGTGGQRVNVDYRMQLIRQRESAAPFLSMMLNLNSEGVQTHQFGAFETRPNPMKANISAGAAITAADTAVTWSFASGEETRFTVGDLVIPKDTDPVDPLTHANVGIVTAVNSGSISVKGNNKALGLVAVTSGTEIQVWGNSFAQGTLSANSSMTKPDRKLWYTQIFKNAYQVTKTHANNRLYGAPERDRLRGEAEIKHVIEIEKALYRGDGMLDTTGADPRTTLTGVINQISSNVLYYGTNLASTSLFPFMTTVHAPKYATDGKMSRRLVLASADILNDINNIAMANRRVNEIVTVYGMDVTKFVWAGRTWDFVEDPILSDLMPGWAVIVQPRYIKLREFRPTRIEANIQANDADYFKDQLLTELGLEVTLEELHGVMRPGVAP